MVSVSVLIPFFTSIKDRGYEAVKKLMSEIFSFFISMMAIVSIVLAIFMPKIAVWLFPGFNTADLSEVVMMSRVLLL